MLRMNGRLYSWDQMKEEFPDRWVVVENPVNDKAGFMLSGKLIAVCNNNEVDDLVVDCYEKGLDFNRERTTENCGITLMCC